MSLEFENNGETAVNMSCVVVTVCTIAGGVGGMTARLSAVDVRDDEVGANARAEETKARRNTNNCFEENILSTMEFPSV